MPAGFTIDASQMMAKMKKLSELKPKDFTYELLEFTRKSLTTASNMTPTRDYSLIRRNQLKQYSDRVNCIPSSHQLIDPSLRIDPRSKKHWLYFSGKWWNASEWNLPSQAWAAYGPLLAEHERRKATLQTTFIRERAQARFLYRKSWSQAAESLGKQISTSSDVRKAESRRKPKQNPPRAFAWFTSNGKELMVQVTNPFLKIHSRYKDFDGEEIMAQSSAQHEGAYRRGVQTRLRQLAREATA